MRLIYDTELRSEIDLPNRGLDIYAKHHTTEMLCATVATDNFIGTCSFVPSSDGREALEKEMAALGLNVVSPDVVIATLRAADVVVASNAPFDQTVTREVLGINIPKERWRCTMARAMRHGLPGSLAAGASVLGLQEGKDKEGNRLMKQLMKPRSTWTKNIKERYTEYVAAHKQHALSIEGASLRIEGKKRTTAKELLSYEDWRGPKWFEDAKRLARNCAYNASDVRVSRELDKRLPDLEPAEFDIWQHVWDMREIGIPVDVEMINGAIAMSEEAQRDLIDRIRAYTSGQIQSLKAPGQLVAWADRYGYYMPSWTKDTVAEALTDPKCPEPVRVVALARQEASRGSVAKFETAAEMVSPDGRLRHQIEYAGTSTLRLAGRGVQPLNLPRPKIEADKSAGLADVRAGRAVRVPTWKLDYDPVRALQAIRDGDLAALRNIGDPEEILSENIRPMICTVPGKKIVSPDLSAIEARGVFWIAGCEKALQGYRRNEDLYSALGSTIVGFPVNKKDNPEERQLGKVGILSCGYGAGAAKVAFTNKIDEETGYRIVNAYRSEYPEVKACWYELENAAIAAIQSPGRMITCCQDRVHFVFDGKKQWLAMRRPSGTWMYLPDAGVDFEGRLFYHSWIKGAWREESIWGGVLINFVVQGMCRELMYHAEMQLARDSRYELFLQCYDSLSALVNADQAQELCDNMIRVMTTPPSWCPDFPLAAEGRPKERYS